MSFSLTKCRRNSSRLKQGGAFSAMPRMTSIDFPFLHTSVRGMRECPWTLFNPFGHFRRLDNFVSDNCRSTAV